MWSGKPIVYVYPACGGSLSRRGGTGSTANPSVSIIHSIFSA